MNYLKTERVQYQKYFSILRAFDFKSAEEIEWQPSSNDFGDPP